MTSKKTAKPASSRGKSKAASPAPKGKAKGELTDQELDKASGGTVRAAVRDLLTRSS